MPQTTYTVRDVARVLGVRVATVYKMLHSGQLKGARIGDLFRITGATLRKKLGLGPKDIIVIPPEKAVRKRLGKRRRRIRRKAAGTGR